MHDPFYSIVATEQLIPSLGNYVWQCNLNKVDVCDVCNTTSYNVFRVEVLEAWCEYNFHAPTSAEEIAHQVIWCNSHVKVNKKPIKWDHVMRAGINTVSDIMAPVDYFTLIQSLSLNSHHA